jgi:hypothetical protein
VVLESGTIEMKIETWKNFSEKLKNHNREFVVSGNRTHDLCGFNWGSGYNRREKNKKLQCLLVYSENSINWTTKGNEISPI